MAVAEYAPRSLSLSDDVAAGMATRDNDAWEYFLHKAAPGMVSYSRGVTGISPEDAQDAVSKVALSTLERGILPEYPSAYYGKAILYNSRKIVQRPHAIPISALEPKGKSDDDSSIENVLFVANDAPVEHQVEVADDFAKVQAIVAHATPQDQIIFRMTYEGYASKDIGETIGITESNTRLRRHRLFARIRKAYEKREKNPGVKNPAQMQDDLLSSATTLLPEREAHIFLARQRGIPVEVIAPQVYLSIGAVNKASRQIRRAMEKHMLASSGYGKLHEKALTLKIPQYIYSKAIQQGKLQTVTIMGMHYVTDAQLQEFLLSREPKPLETEKIELTTIDHLALSESTVQKIAAQLTPHQRRVFLLRQQGLPLDKTAEAVGISYTQAKSAAKNAFETIDMLFTLPNGYERLATVAKRYGLKPTTCFTAAKDGRIPSFQVMGTMYTNDSHVQQFVDIQKKRGQKRSHEAYVIFQATA